MCSFWCRVCADRVCLASSIASLFFVYSSFLSLSLSPLRLAFDYPAEEDLLISMTNRIYDRMVELDRRLIEIERKEKEEDAQTTPTQQQLITS